MAAKKKAAKADGTQPDLEAEAMVSRPEPSEDIPGGVQTTDPSFADGAMEVDEDLSYPPKEFRKNQGK